MKLNKKNQHGRNQNTKDLDFIVESRLSMQSTQRYLDENKIPANIAFIKSENFRDKVYNTWPEFKKKNFLITLAGLHWKKLKEQVEG